MPGHYKVADVLAFVNLQFASLDIRSRAYDSRIPLWL
jgi:hypothetical protein